VLFAAASTFSLIHAPFLNVLAQAGQSELPTPLSTRTITPRFETLGLKDGLSHSNVTDIFQDRNGFMWFATTDGLNRYDGYEIKNYLPIPFDSTQLSSGYIWRVNEDETGALWISTRHGGLNRMDPVTGEFQWFRHDPEDSTSIASDEVWDVLDDGEKYIWVSAGGLGRTDRLNPGKFVEFVADFDDESTLSSNEISQIYRAMDGTIWVATFRGINRIDDPETGRFTRYLTVDASGSSRHHGLVREEVTQWADAFTDLPDRDGLEVWEIVEREEEPGVFWLGTDAGLIRFDTQTGGSATYGLDDQDHDHEAGGFAGVRSVIQDPNSPSILWVNVGGPSDGLYRFDIRAKHFQLYSENSGGRLYADRSGSIWMANDGIKRFSPQAIGFGAPLSAEDDLYNDEIAVWAVHEDRQGIVWIAAETEEREWALFGVDRANDTTIRFDASADSTTIGPDPIWAMLEDSRGQMWLGSAIGLCQFDRRTGKCSYYHPDPADPTALNNGLIRDLTEDAAGNLWVATSGGLHRMDLDEPGVFKRFPTEELNDWTVVEDPGERNRLPGSWVRDVMEDAAGFIWASCDAGLAKIDPNSDRIVKTYRHNPTDSTTLSYPQTTMTHEREREPGIYWVGTYGGGLNRLDDRAGTARHFTTLDGLPSNVVYGILEDEDGRLWLSTNRGISRFDPETEKFRNYGTESGLKSLSMQMYAHDRSSIGEMFFGGRSGVHTFFPNEVRENDSPPEISLIDIKVSNESIGSSGAVVLDASIQETEEIRLSHDQRDLSFDFVAFHFSDPGRNQYAYMLEGFDADWVDSGNRRNATFTNLEPGEYTFRVKAANSDGIWNEEGTSIRVVIAPPWWETWWAYGMYGLLFVAGIFGVDRIQRRRVIAGEREKTREKELEHAKEIETAYNELRTTQDRLIQSEKMASLGQLTAGIAHEIKNPLNFVNNFSDVTVELSTELAAEIESLKSDVPPEKLAEIQSILVNLSINSKKIREHGRRADGIVQNMLEHSKSGEGERTSTDINNLLDEYATLALHGFKARNGDFEVSVERDLDQSIGRINIVPQEMGRVFMNLIGNAFDALKEGGEWRVENGEVPTVTVSTSKTDKSPDGVGNGIEIRISDNGPGIQDDLKSKIFEPFFTTKPTGSGTGLGLSMSYDIVTKGHGGSLEVESEEGKGATFIVRLPA